MLIGPEFLEKNKFDSEKKSTEMIHSMKLLKKDMAYQNLDNMTMKVFNY